MQVFDSHVFSRVFTALRRNTWTDLAHSSIEMWLDLQRGGVICMSIIPSASESLPITEQEYLVRPHESANKPLIGVSRFALWQGSG